MFTLPSLPYSKQALNPHISAETLSFHHEKHHAGYIAKLNSALEGSELIQYSIEELLLNYKSAPENLHAAILNNGGQHFNHSLYWESMSENGGGEPVGMLASAINNEFGSLEEFKKQFIDAGTTQFGSGWAWLSIENNSGKLVIDKTLNADTPLLHGKTPLLTMDVWEHAYYLDYQNRRPDYIEHFFELINWKSISDKYTKYSK